MSYMKVNGYEQGEGCYTRNGIEVTNFLLCAKKVIFGKEGMCKYKFIVTTKDRKTFGKTVTLLQLKRHRFLQEFPLFVKEEDAFYQAIYNTVSANDFTAADSESQTERNGLQEVGGRQMYVFTNTSIAADGFHSEIYSGRYEMIRAYE